MKYLGPSSLIKYASHSPKRFFENNKSQGGTAQKFDAIISEIRLLHHVNPLGMILLFLLFY